MNLCNLETKSRCWRKALHHNHQNDVANFVKFVHTYLGEGGIMIHVKTPQYII